MLTMRSKEDGPKKRVRFRSLNGRESTKNTVSESTQVKKESVTKEEKPKPSMHQVPPLLQLPFYHLERPYYESYTPLVAIIDHIYVLNEKL